MIQVAWWLLDTKSLLEKRMMTKIYIKPHDFIEPQWVNTMRLCENICEWNKSSPILVVACYLYGTEKPLPDVMK